MQKHRLRRLLPLALVLVLSVVIFQPFSVVSAAENDNIIKAGTYRFNDVLSAPSVGISQNLSFTFNSSSPLVGVPFFAEANRIDVISDGVSYDIISTSPDYSQYGFGVPESYSMYFFTDAGYGVGWNMFGFDEGIKTITIPKDTEASDAFSTWFYANVKEQKQISGVWKFNDVLSAPSADIEQKVHFTISSYNSTFDGEFQAEISEVVAYSSGVLVYVLDSINPASPLELPFSLSVYGVEVDGSNGWNTRFDEGIKTIDFGTEPQYVSAEFYDWFSQNAVLFDSTQGGEISMSIVSSITEVWTAVATWFIATMNLVPDLFYDSETGLTFIGTLAIFSGGLAVIIGIIYAVRSWLKSR